MIGGKIRSIRASKGLSLKELAEKTNLTASFLSQIERDLAEPSITSLRNIAEALGVPIFFFLMDDKKFNPVVRKEERKVLKLPKSNLVYELLSPDLNRQMELMIGRLAVGACSVEKPAGHPGEECILVLEGSMKVIVGNEEYLLEEGDSIYYFASMPHQLISCGDSELVYLSAITPPMF